MIEKDVVFAFFDLFWCFYVQHLLVPHFLRGHMFPQVPGLLRRPPGRRGLPLRGEVSEVVMFPRALDLGVPLLPCLVPVRETTG